MKKIIILILALLTAISFSSCIVVPTDPQYAYTLSYANWSDDIAIEEGALNKEILQNEGGAHLPIFKIETLKELEQFKAKYGNVLSMDQGYDEVLSFEETLSKAQYDRDSFFWEHTLLIVYVEANSGSLRFCVSDVRVNDKYVCVYVDQANDPEECTDDMAGWFVLVEVENDQIKNCSSFDAILSKK